LTVTWTGGTPPFQMLLTPVFGTPNNISIPTSAFNNGSGSFSMLLQMQATAQVLLTMSDATGFNSGGTTPVLTVGASKGKSSCNTTIPAIAFSFQLNSALTQCSPFTFTGYTDAVQPVTIAAFIPGGTAFELNPPVGSTSFSWNVNAIHGTSMVFSMADAQGRQGGSSDIRVVGLSGDSTCLNNSSPSSTSAPPLPTTSTSPKPNTTSASPTAPPSHGISMAAIGGTVIASLLFLAAIITLALFFSQKKKNGSQTSGKVRKLPSEINLSFDSRQTPVVTPSDVPRNYDPGLAPRPYYPNANTSFDANPFQEPPSQLISSQHQHPGTFQFPSQHYPPHSPIAESSLPYLSGTEFEATPPQSASSTSPSQRKAAMAGVQPYKPWRYVVHTDADDVPQPNNDGAIELPPRYSERRRILGVANPTPDSSAGHPSGNLPS